MDQKESNYEKQTSMKIRNGSGTGNEEKRLFAQTPLQLFQEYVDRGTFTLYSSVW